MSSFRKVIVLVAAGALAALAVVVTAQGGATATPQRVAVGMSEFKFTVTPKTVKKGVVVFALTNRGAFEHDFKIRGKRSPVVAAGKRRTLSVTFTKAGRFAYLCTVPGHAASGMRGTLVVK